MKKLAIFMTIMILTAAPVLFAEMTADEIIAKHVEAIGGEQAFKDIKSIKMSGNMFASGMPLDFESIVVMPDKAFMQASMNNTQVMSGGVNGDVAWQNSPMMGGAMILEGNDRKNALEQTELSKLLGYKSKGYQAKYLGEDMVKGATAYKIELVDPKDNDTSLFYIDSESFYIVREKSGANTITYSKHEKVGDKIVRPFKVNVSGSSPQGQMMITFESMEINIEVPDSLFVVPADAVPQSEMMKRLQQMQQGAGQGGGN